MRCGRARVRPRRLPGQANHRPARFRGREWYHDGPIVRRFVEEAIEKHGPPRFAAIPWTEPKCVGADEGVRRQLQGNRAEAGDVDTNPTRDIAVSNIGAVTVYLGGSGVTSATGYPLVAGSVPLRINNMTSQSALFAIVSAGTCEVAVLEVGV